MGVVPLIVSGSGPFDSRCGSGYGPIVGVVPLVVGVVPLIVNGSGSSDSKWEWFL